jgi:TM2 domain-containing membrane protein YozV
MILSEQIVKIHIKAALLSAFVLPGLGQLYKGEKVKGVILIIIVNIFILAALYMILKYLAPVILSAQMKGESDVNKILEHLHSGGPRVRFLLATFCAIWMYSWIDAAIGNSRKE